MARYPAIQGKPDANQAAIIKALEDAGATVEANPIGKGVPDLTVGVDGFNYYLEVKTAKGHLNCKQYKWHNAWKGHKAVVRTPQEALEACGLRRIDPPTPQELRRLGAL